MNKRKAIPEIDKTETEFSLTEYFGKDIFENAEGLFGKINEPVFKRIKTGVNHINLNWWVREGVIEKNNNVAGKFTFTEFIWVKMVEQMRLFNAPLPYLAKLKELLFQNIKIEAIPTKEEEVKKFIKELELSETEKKKLLGFISPLKNTNDGTGGKDTGVTILQLLILECILKRIPLGIAFFANGAYLIIDKSKEHLYSANDLKLLNSSTYISVSVSNLISEFLRSDLAFTIMPKINLLTSAENKFYETIHTGNYENIIVTYKDKKIKPLELKKSDSLITKINEVLSDERFSEIVIKNEKGIVTKIEQKNKIAF